MWSSPLTETYASVILKNEMEAVAFFFFDCMQCKLGLTVAL